MHTAGSGGIVTYYREGFEVAHIWRTDRGDYYWADLISGEKGHCQTSKEAHHCIASLVPLQVTPNSTIWRGLFAGLFFELLLGALGHFAYCLWQ